MHDKSAPIKETIYPQVTEILDGAKWLIKDFNAGLLSKQGVKAVSQHKETLINISGNIQGFKKYELEILNSYFTHKDIL